MRRTICSFLLVTLVLAVSGCGAEKASESAGKPDDAGTPTATPTATPTSASESAEPSATAAATPFDDKGNEIIRGTIEADTPEEMVVVDAWFAYWDARARSFGAAELDPKLGDVAAVDALADVVSYVDFLRSKKLRTVGDTKFAVRNLDLQATSAQLVSCGVNKSIDRRADGSPAEKFSPFFTLKGTLTSVAGTWKVIQVETVSRTPCKA